MGVMQHCMYAKSGGGKKGQTPQEIISEVLHAARHQYMGGIKLGCKIVNADNTEQVVQHVLFFFRIILAINRDQNKLGDDD